jgi:predicted NBD/HSP70 family sugar kinase
MVSALAGCFMQEGGGIAVMEWAPAPVNNARNATPSSPGLGREEPLSGLGGGANQAGGRAYNERLTLSLIWMNGPLTRAELARLTGLAPQTLSHIVRRLEQDGLLVGLERLRGRVGQPSTPYRLNPDGAFSFGVKIGRRSTEIVVCDFSGAVRHRLRRVYAYPEPQPTLDYVVESVRALQARLAPGARIAGLGIAMPFEMWKWAEEVSAPQGALDGWKTIDVKAVLETTLGMPTCLANDATAACGAELARAPRSATIDWLYIFVGSFVGGGIVLNGSLYQGRTGNAGAIGSLPVAVGGRSSQLVHHASLITLERALIQAGIDPALLQQPGQDWASLGAALEEWVNSAADALSTAIVAAASIIDFQRVTIDGALPRAVLETLVAAVIGAKSRLALDGLSPIEVEPGHLGSDARVLGGAFLPLAAQFFVGQEAIQR